MVVILRNGESGKIGAKVPVPIFPHNGHCPSVGRRIRFKPFFGQAIAWLKLQLASLSPNAAVLKKLRQLDGRICPLTCSARYVLKNNECVLKTCPAGQLLSSAGQCYTKSKPSPQSSSSGGNCFTFNGQQYCD